jgi:hypothetical protein
MPKARQFDDRNAQELKANKVKNITSKGIKYSIDDDELLFHLEEEDASFTFNTESVEFSSFLKKISCNQF